MFLVFDGSKAVNANRRATAEATIDAKVAGAPASRINMKTQQPISKANKAKSDFANAPLAKLIRASRTATPESGDLSPGVLNRSARKQARKRG